MSKKGVVTLSAIRETGLQTLTEVITALGTGLAAGQLTAR